MRRQRNLSEADLAWEMGIARAHLQDIEEGTAEVDLVLMAQVAGAFGISLSALVETL